MYFKIKLNCNKLNDTLAKTKQNQNINKIYEIIGNITKKMHINISRTFIKYPQFINFNKHKYFVKLHSGMEFN